MEISTILNQIPKELTDKLAEETGINHSIQRLRGRVMLDLLLFGMIRSERLSTRTLEHFYNSSLFSSFSSKDKGHQTRHSSIASRLNTMNPDYFKALFDWAFQTYFSSYGGSKFLKKLVRFDSTMIKISSALVEWGMRVGRKPKNKPQQVQLKVTLGLKGLFPKSVEVFTDQGHLSEETALKEAIKNNLFDKDDIVSFDLGLKSRKTLQDFDNERIKFVTRGTKNLRYKQIQTLKASEELEKLSILSKKNNDIQSLEFLEDSKVYLYASGAEPIEHPFRLIKVKVINKQGDDEILYFITNIWDLEPDVIAQIYRHRWDIEVFFRFIKQELNIKHLLSHSLNGIKIQIFVTFLLAILLTVFKMSNNIKGYKIAKIKFEDQLIFHIFKELQRAKQLIHNTKNSVF